MTIPTETLEQWLQEAKKATQGKWVNHNTTYRGNARVDNEREEMVCRMPNDLCDDFERGNKDAVHIANLCPANAIALIEELIELREFEAEMALRSRPK